jgi:hypothetical protein
MIHPQNPIQDSAQRIIVNPLNLFTHLPKPFLVLVTAYFFTSLGHFAHNAEYLCEYLNLPTRLTRAKVYEPS